MIRHSFHLRPALTAGLALLASCGAPPERLDFDVAAVLEARSERAAEDSRRRSARDVLSVGTARELALAHHPALQLAARRAAAPLAEADRLRRFEGPLLGLDLERIVSGASDPFEWVALLGFELPLGGAFDARRRALEAESRLLFAEACELAFEHLSEVDEQYVVAFGAGLRRDVLEGHVAALEGLLETVELSEAAGVLETLEGDLVRFARVSAAVHARSAASERAVALAELHRLMGLAGAPTAEVSLLGRDELFALLDGGPLTEADVARLDAPTVAVAAARLQLAEEELALAWEESRGTFGLAAGPGGKDGEDIVSLGAEVPLAPTGTGRLARARAERDLAGEALAVAVEARADAVARSRDGAAAARARRLAVEDELLPLAERQLERLERMRDLGELRVLIVLEALEGRLAAELERLDHALDELRARLALEALQGPPPHVPSTNDHPSTLPTEERPR